MFMMSVFIYKIMSAKEQQNFDICRISSSAFVNGTMCSLSDIRIDGRFKGDIVAAGKLVLGKQAVVEGSIICNSADIFGCVTGDIYAKELLSFKSSAKFKGNLKIKHINIETGAAFEGTCCIIDEKSFDEVYKGRMEAMKS